MTFASASGTFSTVNGLTGPGWSFTEALEANSVDLDRRARRHRPSPPTRHGRRRRLLLFLSIPGHGRGGPAITYSATGLPAWAQLNASTGVLTGTPPTDGTFEFSVTASDGVLPEHDGRMSPCS